MKVGRILGAILVIVGAALLYSSHYINTQVEEGRAKISSGQRQVDTASHILSVNPISKEIGKQFTNSAQKKINAGTLEADQYAKYAAWFRIGGILSMAAGVGVFFFVKR